MSRTSPHHTQELCLAPVVAAGVDPVVVLEAAQSLAPRQALALLRYLAAWLRLHDQVPLTFVNPRTSTSVVPLFKSSTTSSTTTCKSTANTRLQLAMWLKAFS